MRRVVRRARLTTERRRGEGRDSRYNEMARVKSRRGRLHVSIVADTKAPYGLIVRILDAAKSVSLDDVGFVTG
jgi:biopolymer transport protein ExbD